MLKWDNDMVIRNFKYFSSWYNFVYEKMIFEIYEIQEKKIKAKKHNRIK